MEVISFTSVAHRSTNNLSLQMPRMRKFLQDAGNLLMFIVTGKVVISPCGSLMCSLHTGGCVFVYQYFLSLKTFRNYVSIALFN